MQRIVSMLMLPAGAVASGSHSDSIVQGGAYDGALGVIGAIAAVQVSDSAAPSAGARASTADHHTWAASVGTHGELLHTSITISRQIKHHRAASWHGLTYCGGALSSQVDSMRGRLVLMVAMQALRDAGFQPAKPLEVIMFTTEEASRFSVPCLGRCCSCGHLLACVSRTLVHRAAPQLVVEVLSDIKTLSCRA